MEELKGIKTWSEEDRPREKMLTKGASALSDAELMAILIGSGNQTESAVDLSRRILRSVDHDLVKLGKMTLREMTSFRGMGQVKSLTVMAAIELGKRRRAGEFKAENRIRSSRDVYERFLEYMSDLRHEEFWVMCLNRSNNVLCIGKIGEGGLSSTIADPKKVFRLALENNAASIIVAHNHPSGNLSPSQEDNKLTEKLRQNGSMLECPLLDHIIVTDSGYYSYADEGNLTI
ncbi:MAG: DNA repair protein RadC [Flavobacteriales bacterium]|nr:DNA repair protein RadC [Flavobacteriales bacterium]